MQHQDEPSANSADLRWVAACGAVDAFVLLLVAAITLVSTVEPLTKLPGIVSVAVLLLSVAVASLAARATYRWLNRLLSQSSRVGVIVLCVVVLVVTAMLVPPALFLIW